MRKAIGFLVLGAVVAAGVVFVERGLDSRRREAGGGGRSMTLLLGGSSPRQAAASTRPDPSPVEPSTHGRTVVPRRAPETASRRSPPERYEHVVRPGEVLGRIVEDYLGTAAPAVLRRVARDSGLEDPDRIRPGVRLSLRVPRWRSVRVESGETLADVARRTLGSARRTGALRHANPDFAGRSDSEPLPPGIELWVPDVR